MIDDNKQWATRKDNFMIPSDREIFKDVNGLKKEKELEKKD